jgi:hypothetical protein
MRLGLILGAAAAVIAVAVGVYVYSTRPNGGLDPKIATAYVDAQAHALCVVQTTAFPTQAAQTTAYKEAQQAAGLTADEFADAQAAAAKDQALRQRLSDRVVALCG